MSVITNNSSWTLLDIVNHILSSTSLEPVTDIYETVESEQVLDVVKGTFYDIVTLNEWAYHRSLFKLYSATDSERPTHLILPKNVKDIVTLSYDVSKYEDETPNLREMEYVLPEVFLHRSNRKSTEKSNVKAVTDHSGVSLYVNTNREPSYYTSFDDKVIILDSYDENEGSTLKGSKTQVLGHALPSFESDNDWTPNMPEGALMYLIEDSKSTASMVLISEFNQKAEQRSDQIRRHLTYESNRVSREYVLPDYGRRGRFNRRSNKFPRG